MQSAYQQCTFFTLRCFCLVIVESHGMHSLHTNSFVMKRELMNKSWIFFIPILAILWASVCPDWRNWLQKCIRATRSCSFKAWTTVALHGHSLTILWPFVLMLSKHSSRAEKFSVAFSSGLFFIYLKYSCTKNGCCSTIHLSWGMPLHHWRTEKCIYQQRANDS
jgi:hypothetical protein